MTRELVLPAGYGALLERLKSEIAAARTRAALKVNQELVRLYWRIGREILARQERERWGTKVIDRLARDLKHAFPEMRGLSAANLRHMRAFAATWPDWRFCSQAVSKLPWGHNLELVYKLDDSETRLWYAENAVRHGWSRNVLQHHILTRRHEREGKAISNFAQTLPAPQSELVQQVIHDPYNLEFLDLTEDAKERDLEKALLAELQRFMLELGAGFAFVGSQVPIEVGGDEFFLDLLFFHTLLNRYVVIDLKIGKFRPEHAGKINFYVNVVDDKLRQPHHEPTIGVVFCTGKNKQVVKYALGGVTKPVGVTGYTTKLALVEQVPDRLEGRLPEVPELTAGLERIASNHAQEIEAAERRSELPPELSVPALVDPVSHRKTRPST